MSELGKELMWGGRFEKAPEKSFYEFQRSLAVDFRLLPYELAVDRAWARALARAGIITKEESEQIQRALEDIGARAKADPNWVANSPAEDVHHFVEMELVARLGAVGAKLHTGRSRNELVVTDFRMFVREATRETRRAIAALIRALLDQAERHFDVPMAGNTHLQHAQPILYSHFLLGHSETFFRSAVRVAHAYEDADGCPMGSGALAGCAFPIDREAIARELGFTRITTNSLSATSHRGFALDYHFALAMLATNLSRLAADFSLFATPEFGYIVLPDEYSTGSSLMPQKKNPDVWELIRGKAGRVIAALFALFTTLKGLPTGYQRDLQEDKLGLFQAHDETVSMLRMAAGAIAATGLNEVRMREAASDPGLLATEAADYLVSKGVPFRQAHEAVGAVVREAERRGHPWTMLPLAKLRQFAPEFDSDLHEWLTVEASLARRSVPGGTAPQAVRNALADARKRLAELEGNS
jgi:argininosuccinate lyase